MTWRVVLSPVVERLNLQRERVDETEKYVALGAQRRRQRHAREPDATGLAVERSVDLVLGAEMPMNAVLELRGLAHEERRAAEQLSTRAGRGVGDPDGGQQLRP